MFNKTKRKQLNVVLDCDVLREANTLRGRLNWSWPEVIAHAIAAMEQELVFRLEAEKKISRLREKDLLSRRER